MCRRLIPPSEEDPCRAPSPGGRPVAPAGSLFDRLRAGDGGRRLGRVTTGRQVVERGIGVGAVIVTGDGCWGGQLDNYEAMGRMDGVS